MTVKSPAPTPRQVVTPPPASDGFDGKLRCPSVADLVQLECLSGARAAIEIRSGAGRGFLFFEQGQLVHARTETTVGERAALEILNWKTGTFSDAEAPWPPERSVELPWQELLLRAAQLCDEEGAASMPQTAKSGSRLAAVTTLRPPAPPSKFPSAFPSSAPPSRMHAVRAAKIDARGQLLAHSGEHQDELIDLSSYLRGLVTLIGRDLGLSEFRELVWDRKHSRLTLHLDPAGNHLVIEAPKGTDLATVKRQLEQ